MNRLYTFFSFLLLFTSCLDVASNTKPNDQKGSSVTNPVECSTPGSCNGITGDDDEIEEGTEENPIAKVELRHLIEPKIDDQDDGGEYKRKLTIPKNYDGYLYLAGVNISSLASKSVVARFRFGIDGSPIDIPAIVSTAPGLTPKTDVEVLVLKLDNRPFDRVNLSYDLFDYNNYDFSGSSSDPGALSEPVQFNRDDHLFCRGLTLEDDNTFTGNISAGCKNESDTCKYAYAKVVDKGLIKREGSLDIPINPSERNIESASAGYYNDENETKLKRCLPDNPDLTGGAYVFDLTNTFNGLETAIIIDSELYVYRGPYRPINNGEWEISDDAVVGKFGLFNRIPDFNNNGQLDSDELKYGQQSLLFPLYATFDLVKDVQFLGNEIPDQRKDLSVMPSNGESSYLDGCNLRASTVDEITGDHIGSCNVTGKIEIVIIEDDGSEIVVDTTNEVKLQLVKSSIISNDGSEVLIGSFKRCSSSSQCGADSCCINNSCWSKNLVSQCIEDLPSFGDLETGERCESDYECSSLCCNRVRGTCAPHNTIDENPVLCSKQVGQTCVSKEFCQKHPFTVCRNVSTGNDQLGNPTCALRCVTLSVFGECATDTPSGPGRCTKPCEPVNEEASTTCENALPNFDALVQVASDPVQACQL